MYMDTRLPEAAKATMPLDDPCSEGATPGTLHSQSLSLVSIFAHDVPCLDEQNTCTSIMTVEWLMVLLLFTSRVRLGRVPPSLVSSFLSSLTSFLDLLNKVMNSTRWLLKRAFNVLLEGVPDSIDYNQLRQRLSEIHGMHVCIR